jgi:hypothetical protein
MHRVAPFLLIALLALTGCGAGGIPTTDRTPTDVSASALIEAKAERDAARRDAESKAAEVTQLTERIAQAQAAKDAAVAKGDRLAQLQAEKDELLATATLAGVQKREAQEREKAAMAAIGDKDKEIASERTAVAQAKLYWFAGLLGLVALIAVGLAIWMPLTRRWTGGFAVACGAVAALAVFVASILPWLWWIGAGVLTVGVIAAITWWHRDHHTAVQVVAAVEGIKDRLPDYKTHFRQEIDSHVDSWINRIRAKLGPKKAA